MSWYIGSQLTAQSAGDEPTPAGPLNASMFADRLRWVTTTPFGAEVEPEVNCTKAMSSADTATARSRCRGVERLAGQDERQRRDRSTAACRGAGAARPS